MQCHHLKYMPVIVFAAAACLLLTFQAAAQQWKPMPIRNQLQYNAGIIGGEAEQHMLGIARSLANPDVIYLAHDCGQVWRSIDNGETWKRATCKGMYLHAAQSVEVDPVYPNIVYAILDASFNYWGVAFEGIYRSNDFGESWDLVAEIQGEHQSGYKHTIAFDSTSIDENGAKRWYAAFPNGGVYLSEDYGQTWDFQTSLSGHESVYSLYCKPGSSNTIYLATSQGLFKSTTKGLQISPIGDLPAGTVTSMAIRADQPESLYAVIQGTGVFKSINGGINFTPILSAPTIHVFVNPGFPDWLYTTNTSGNARISSNDGQSWWTTVVHPPVGESGGWNSSFKGAASAISPDPRNTLISHAYGNAALWKSTDGGHNYYDGSTLFLGHNWGWWNDSIAYDVEDPNRWAQFCADVGMDITYTGADWFDSHPIPYTWYQNGLIDWVGMHAGDFYPSPGSPVIVACVGRYWNTKLIRSTNNGANWTLVDDRTENHYFIAFNTDDPNIVYAGNKISDNAGLTFSIPSFLDSSNASILGMCRAQPNTIYAMANSPRRTLYRSDDAGETWETYVTTTWNMNQFDGQPTFTVDPNNPDVIYTLYNNRDLARYDGQTWTALGVLDAVGPSPYTNFPRSVHIDPRNSDIIYVSMFVPGIPVILRSTDYGQTWEDISRNMPRLGGQAISVNPHTGDLMASACCGTRIFPPPYESPDSIYNKLSSYEEIQGKYFFYNNSAFDGNDPAINDDDYAAIAIDKIALMSGQTASFMNYTSYDKGINGIIIDFQKLGDDLTAADFEFLMGNSATPENWPAAPAPTNIVTVHDFGPDQLDRVIITFDDYAIVNQWLAVKVLAGDHTGLSIDNTLYFGNAVGDTGNSTTDTIVDATDEIASRNNPRNFFRPAEVDYPYDHNRDGKVDATDEIICRNHVTTMVNQLKLFIAP